MSKKLIISSILAVIVIAVGITGALILSHSQTSLQPTAEFDNTSSTVYVTPPDLSKDYGACTLLDKATIKSTLGEVAMDLQGPDNMGRAYIGNGDESQICVYAFVPGGTFNTGFNKGDSFSVEVYVYQDQASKDADLAVKDDSVTLVEGVGERATYATYTDEGLDRVQYYLKVYSGLKRYNYDITQPQDGSDFTIDTAKAVLETIAKSVTY